MMDQIDGLASNIGYAVITGIVSIAALYAVIRFAAAWWAAKAMFLCAWGLVGIVAPIYSFLAISLPADRAVSGAIASFFCITLIGGPFIYFGWPKLRQMFTN
ncbi:hypothetical protein BYI23_B004570 [Burkholderia sp. YI23]|nr:hypothetical protein BYI23_B004570 [Burkholderia sp. YI23]